MPNHRQALCTFSIKQRRQVATNSSELGGRAGLHAIQLRHIVFRVSLELGRIHQPIRLRGAAIIGAFRELGPYGGAALGIRRFGMTCSQKRVQSFDKTQAQLRSTMA